MFSLSVDRVAVGDFLIAPLPFGTLFLLVAMASIREVGYYGCRSAKYGSLEIFVKLALKQRGKGFCQKDVTATIVVSPEGIMRCVIQVDSGYGSGLFRLRFRVVNLTVVRTTQ